MTTALAFYSMPTHWLGLMLVILFAGMLPTGGMTNEFLINPSFCDARQGPRPRTSSAVADPRARALRRVHADRALGHARDARRGLHPHGAREGPEAGAILRKHALRNAMLPIATLVALSLGYIVAGAILVETVFSWPGIGRARLRRGAAARLPDAAGRVPAADDLGRLLQPRRRPPLLQARPEDRRNERRTPGARRRHRDGADPLAPRARLGRDQAAPVRDRRRGDPAARHPRRPARAGDRAL